MTNESERLQIDIAFFTLVGTAGLALIALAFVMYGFSFNITSLQISTSIGLESLQQAYISELATLYSTNTISSLAYFILLRNDSTYTSNLTNNITKISSKAVNSMDSSAVWSAIIGVLCLGYALVSLWSLKHR